MPVYFSNAIMSTFQVSVTANADDVDGSFRTSLRSSSAQRKPSKPKNHERNGSATRTAGTATKASSTGTAPDESLPGGTRSLIHSSSYRDSVFDSLDSYRSSSFTSGPSRNRTDSRKQGLQSSRQSRSSAPSRSRSRPGSRAGGSNGYDATIYNEAPMVARYGQSGEMYQPVSYAWQAFKERLFDSSLSEKYETLQVDSTPRNQRRYRSLSASPAGLEDDNPYEEFQNTQKQLLFLQDPLARSMYKNLESFFDRKNLIRDAAGDLTSRHSPDQLSSAHQHYFNHGETPNRPQSSLDFRSSTARSLDPPRSQSSLDTTRSSSGSFFGRRKKEQPQSTRAHSEERPEDIRKAIQLRFAKIDFEEGTTDYDALFTVSEEGGDISGTKNGDMGDLLTVNGQPDRGRRDSRRDSFKDTTPKSKLDHLRF